MAEPLSSLKQAFVALQNMQAELDEVKQARAEPIAILGMGCRFPGGGSDPEAFWRSLDAGVDAVTQVPADRWAVGDDPGVDPAQRAVRWGAFLDDVRGFDAGFFGISPREAEKLDPQQRLLLEVTWEALEHAGIAPERLLGTRTSVFLGITTNDYAELCFALSPEQHDVYMATGNGHCFPPGRLAYTLGLQGAALAVDTACSSSLTAVHLACQALRNGECGLALVGGVNLMLSPSTTSVIAQTHALSPEGRCKTFDASANGFVRGEGCGLVVLKRLSDARRDGDPILALIRGSAVNQDGRSTGLTAPNVLAQQAMLRQAFQAAGVAPGEIGYVECHGTGTSLGDPIEVDALSEVLAKERDPAAACVLGAVKTNLGHLEAAAGIAGLIKAVLALGHEAIPRNVHFKTLNPRIRLAGTPFVVPTRTTPWPRGQKRRFAGVSAFGMSGTNAHVVLEEARAAKPAPESPARPAELLVVSARSAEALSAQAARLRDHLEAHPEIGLYDVAFSLATTRSPMEQRLAVVASSREGLLAALDAAAQGQTPPCAARGAVTAARGRLAFLFTGQGAQVPGMGRGLCAQWPAFREPFERCLALFDPELERPLREVIHAEPGSADAALLDQTAYTQPALFALEYALCALWRAWGVTPDLVAGHSVGELVAACVAGVFSLEDAVKLVAARGRLMQALPPGGAMVSIAAPEAEVAAALALALAPDTAQVSIAAINGPAQVVIAGAATPVQAVAAAFAARGVRVKPLRVSHAFHSPLMDPMLAAFGRVAGAVTYRRPSLPLISNLSGRLCTDEVTTPAYWVRHVREAVRFADGVNALHDAGAATFLEVGPKPTLLGMVPTCLPEAQPALLASLRAGREETATVLEALGGLWSSGGGQVTWTGLFPAGGRRVTLPTYPWQRQRYWVEAPRLDDRRRTGAGHRPRPEGHPLLGEAQALSTHAGLCLWETALDPRRLPWLRDPGEDGAVVLPGAAYLEMALASGAGVLRGAPFEVVRAVFAESLTLSNDAPVTVQLVTQDEPSGELRFQIASRASGPDPRPDEEDGRAAWTVHAHGALRPTARDAAPAGVVPDALRAWIEAAVPTAETHAAAGTGLDRGAAREGLTDLWRGESEALGRLQPTPLPDSATAAYQVHPALLDACFQVLGLALSDPNEATPWVPVEVAALRLFQRPSGALWCHAGVTADPQDPPALRRGDLRLLDATGALVAEISGLVMKRGARRRAPDDWLTAAEPTAREARLTEFLRAEIARVLHVAAAEVRVDAPFTLLGMDSLMGMELRNRAQAALDIALPATLFVTHPSTAALARVLLDTWLERRGDPAGRHPKVRRTPRDGALPLSYAQEQMWFLHELQPASSAYSVAAQIRIRGPLDHPTLARSLDAIVARHEVLRTTFRSAMGVPEPVIAASLRLDLPIHDARDDAGVRAWALRDALAPFDLASGPLLRARLLRLGDADHALIVVMHHIITDGWSFAVLLRELTALYGAFQRGEPSPLPELAVQYTDYAAWQRQALRPGVLDGLRAFWKRDLEGAPTLDLPTDRPRPPAQTFRGARLRFELGRSRAGALRRLCEQEGVTLFIPLLAAFAAVLHRYAGQDDIVIGTLNANRTRLEIEGLIGFFVNALPVRVDLAGDPDVRELLSRVRRRMLAVTAHQDLPFEQIVQVAERRRDASRNPVFQVQLVLQAAVPALDLPGLSGEVIEIDTATAKRDLTLTIFEGEALAAHLEYATDLFDAVRIERLVEHFGNLVDAFTEDPAQRLSSLPLLTAPEQALYVKQASGRRTGARSIQQLFEATVDRAPGAIAVAASADGASLTYRQLDDAANRLARWLRDRGVGPNTAVALRVGRSPEMLIGLLGILKAGGVYVPIDPAYPKDRIDTMLADVKVAVALESVVDPEIAAGSPERLDTKAMPDQLAYGIYTSGSTGRPKGVMVTHGSVVDYADTLGRELGIGPGDVYLHTASISFSSSIRQALIPLCAGATVVIADDDERRDPRLLLGRIRDAGVTVVDLVPTVVRQVVDAVAALSPEERAALLDNRLRLLLTASEALRFDLVRDFRAQVGGGARWINMYGQTETTGIVSLYPVPEAPGEGRGIVPIGRPRGNVAMVVLDRQRRPLPCGVFGDLYIGGEALAVGYAADPALTSARFVPSPWGDGERLYAAGDVVRLGWDGTIEFVGRSDGQVKIRGLRIEPAEIERVLLEHPGVREAVVSVRDDGSGGQRLVAYFTAGGAVIPLGGLRAYSASKLPQHMVPSAFVALDRLPLTPNGKLDRAALPEPEGARAVEVAYLPPAGRVEEALAGIWREVLRVDRVGAGDNFFSLGGHSLLAAHMRSRIQSALGVDLPLRAIFEDQTLSTLAARIEASATPGWRQALPPLLPVARGQGQSTTPASHAQESIWRLEQAEPGSRAHWIEVALRIRGPLDAAIMVQSVQEAARRQELLRTVFRPSNGALTQVILPPGALDVALLDGSGTLAGEAAPGAIDLTTTPPIRAALVRRGEGDHLLLLSVHRILCDGLSMRLLLGEIGALYSGRSTGTPAPLPAPAVRYADYAAWERGWLTGETLERQLAFFRRELEGAEAAFTLPTDHPRPARRLRRGGQHRFELAREASEAARAMAARERASLYTVLLAAFAAAIGKHTGQPDVVIGAAVSRRTHPETERMFGPFMNTVPLRIGVSDRAGLKALLAHVKAVMLAGLEHQDAPFGLVVAEATAAYGAAAAGIGQVALVLGDAGDAARGGFAVGDLSLSPLEPEEVTSRRELTLSITVTDGDIAGTFTYDRELFELGTIERIRGDFEAAVGSARDEDA